MSTPFLGESYALGAALCWAIGPLIAYKGVKGLGTFRFSMYRFAISALALGIIAYLLGQFDFSDPRALAFLAVSGIIGVAFGEAALFQAVFLLGPRRSSLIFTLHAPLTAILGTILFQEIVSVVAFVGVALAFGGVYTAVVFRPANESSGGEYAKPDALRLGLLLVGIAVVCQIAGALLAKEVISGVDPFFGSFVRTCAAAIAFIPIYVWLRERHAVDLRQSLSYVALSALVSTIGGMTLLLAAFANTEIFRAVILSSLTPVLYVILMSIFRGERFPPIVWIGTVVAVLGVMVTLSAV